MLNSDKLVIFGKCQAYKKRASYWADCDFTKFKHFYAKYQAIYHLIIDLGLLEEYKLWED